MKIKGLINFVSGLGLLVFASTSNALVIDATDYTVTGTTGAYVCSGPLDCWAEDVNGYDVNSILGTTGLEMIYKAEVGDEDSPATTEEGAYAPFYETTFSNTALDPQDALIEFVGSTDSIICPECFLAVKDGNQNPNFYLFDIGTWDGMEDINLLNFWTGRGAISHVSIWGHDYSVPEPSTVAMMGIGLIGMGAAARRRNKKS